MEGCGLHSFDTGKSDEHLGSRKCGKLPTWLSKRWSVQWIWWVTYHYVLAL